MVYSAAIIERGVMIEGSCAVMLAGFFHRLLRGVCRGGFVLATGLLLFLSYGAPPLMADPFTISNVPVKATAKDAAAAKTVALQKGQREAFRRLINRLTRPADRQYLPKVKNEDIESLVAGFSLSDERPSPKNYQARMTVRFIGGNVREYLENYGVPIADVTATPVLLIPLLDEGGKVELDPGNDWFEAWSALDLENTLTPILLPVGDASDLSVDPAQLAQGRPEDLEMLKERYSVSGVLVAVAKPRGAGNVLAFLKGNSSLGRVEFENTYASKAGREDAMRTAAQGIVQRLENRWKNANVSANTGASETLVVSVPFRGLNEWIIIRKRLNTIPGVAKMDIRAMTARGAHVILTYSGSIEQLTREMEQRNLEMTDQGQFWELRAY